MEVIEIGMAKTTWYSTQGTDADVHSKRRTQRITEQVKGMLTFGEDYDKSKADITN